MSMWGQSGFFSFFFFFLFAFLFIIWKWQMCQKLACCCAWSSEEVLNVISLCVVTSVYFLGFCLFVVFVVKLKTCYQGFPKYFTKKHKWEENMKSQWATLRQMSFTTTPLHSKSNTYCLLAAQNPTERNISSPQTSDSWQGCHTEAHGRRCFLTDQTGTSWKPGPRDSAQRTSPGCMVPVDKKKFSQFSYTDSGTPFSLKIKQMCSWKMGGTWLRVHLCENI